MESRSSNRGNRVAESRRSALDPDEFILDECWYDSGCLATSTFDGVRFAITPRLLSTKSLAWMIAGVLVAGLAIALFLQAPGQGWESWLAICVVVTGVVGGLCAIWWVHRRVWQGGPWLIYDTVAQQISLPRHGVNLDRASVLHIEEISTKSLERPTWHLVSELNLVAMVDNRRQRWHLLTSHREDDGFTSILLALRRHTDLPTVRKRGFRLGWEVKTFPPRGGPSAAS